MGNSAVGPRCLEEAPRTNVFLSAFTVNSSGRSSEVCCSTDEGSGKHVARVLIKN